MRIGIDLGGSHISVAIISPEGKILRKQEKDISFVDVAKDNIKTLIRDTIVSLINTVLRESQIPIFVVKSIGIGIPGIVVENKIEKCKKFDIENWDLAKELEEFYAIEVKIKNDVECAAIAEYKYGNLKGVSKGAFVCLGTGIGGANIINGIIYPAEYGHMIIEKQGNSCHCLNRGCLETYCSMKVFKDKIIKLLNLKQDTPSKEILENLKKEIKNPIIDEYINNYIEEFIIGIGNIINIINPEVIVFGGSFIYFQDILYKRLLEKIQLYEFQFKIPKLLLSNMQNNAGVIGAAIM